MNNLFIVVLVSVALYWINEIMRSYKGRDSTIELLIKRTVDLMKYTMDETKGNVVQKINAGLGFVLILAFIGTLIVSIIKYVMNNSFASDLKIALCSLIILLFITVVFCEKFTRHRY